MANEDELRLRERLSKLGGMKLLRGTKLSGELARLQDQLDHIRADPSAEEIWQSVELARHADRPYTLDYVERIFEDFFELHGDRGRADDHALVTGLGKLGGRTVVLVGHQKGRDLKERTNRNFGMAYPEGYRKAMRAMTLAERHGFPLVTLVDTPGAYPGVAAEQHGQGGAIARSQAAMVRLNVPTVACVIGEGGSGGAIAIAVADRVLMQENAIYSVISPEGCAAILWRDASEARKAAAAFKPDAVHCLELGVIDGIVAEPEGGAHLDADAAATLLEQGILAALDEIEGLDPVDRRRERRAKYRVMGILASVSISFHRFHRLIPGHVIGAEQGKAASCGGLVKELLRFGRQSTDESRRVPPEAESTQDDRAVRGSGGERDPVALRDPAPRGPAPALRLPARA